MPADDIHEYDLFCAKQFVQDFKEFTARWWGEPCPDRDPDCACCKAWMIYEDFEQHMDLG